MEVQFLNHIIVFTGTSVGKNKNWVQTSPLVRSSIKPLRRSLFSHVPPTITFVHHNEVNIKKLHYRISDTG